MGVTGLWKLIDPCGKPVPVETLEGKILAVDISIWLHQAVKGFQDSKGSALAHAHLLGLFHRLCKLLYYRIKPVFVFDGCVPQLKRDTILRRQQQRSKLNSEADRIQALLLQSLAKEKLVQEALGAEGAAELSKSPSKKPTSKQNARQDVDDMFKLPELPSTSANSASKEGESDCNESSFTGNEDYSSESETESSSFDESNARHAYNVNLQAIDVRSQHFKNLPADVRHEILVDIKETRKQSSWGRLQDLPSRSDDYSTFQMKRLLKRRAVQESLEEAEQEMGGQCLTYAQLQSFFTEEGILDVDDIKEGTKQISSNEHTRFLLVRDLKKQLSKIPETKEEEVKEEKCDEKKEQETISSTKEEVPTGETSSNEQDDKKIQKDKLGKEYEEELELAIAMSLEQSTVYKEEDYEYESNEQVKLNRNQRKNLKDAATGPARSYMIEYGGMNVEEVQGMMEKSQMRESEFESFLEDLETVHEDKEPSKNANIGGEMEEKDSTAPKANSQEIRLHVSDESSDSESDFEEVPETQSLHGSDEETNKEIIPENPNKLPQSSLEIKIDLEKPFSQEDDLFADIFVDETNKEKSKEPEVIRENISFRIPDEIPGSQPSTSQVSKAATLNILADLEKQLREVKNMQLENIKLNDSQCSVIEISDDELGGKQTVETCTTEPKKEIIEIYDSDDTQAKKPEIGQHTPSRRKSSPSKTITPTKNHTISEYFQTSYVIKRTPEKSKDTDEEEEQQSTTPKVKSPFFVKKTPKSKQKNGEANSARSSPNSASKATKSLFSESTEERGDVLELDNEIRPLEPTPVDTEEIMKEAAEALRSNKTEEELQSIASDLAKERRELEAERNRQDRMGMSINQRMSSECQELLRLFGVPYIVAPMEAEAQCAFLDSMNLTNGTITDDSDIWLFGGQTVYKNFFAQSKHVLEFRAEKIENTFSCDRRKLIQLACLVGSDYTTGILGIGAVTAMEILAAFSGATPNKLTYQRNSSDSEKSKILETLCRFRDWWLMYKNSTTPVGSSTRLALKKKLKNIELYEGFPNGAVIEAYLVPKVDENREPFTWGEPDVDTIIEYARKNFGWTRTKTNEILTPVLKRISDKKSQSSIRNYFTVSSALTVHRPNVSKRVQKAIDKMSGLLEAETPEKVAKPKTRCKRKSQPEAGEQDANANEDESQEDGKATRSKKTRANDDETTDGESKNATGTKRLRKPRAKKVNTEGSEAPTTSEAERPSGSRKRVPVIPDPEPAIPQREKDKLQTELNRAKAIEIFKKYKVNTEDNVEKKKRKT